ncbi:MAG: caspase family protein, partial [Elusimicrobia bacterium]|nr:caspase family protein [Elusimicrobiota bacterium]
MTMLLLSAALIVSRAGAWEDRRKPPPRFKPSPWGQSRQPVMPIIVYPPGMAMPGYVPPQRPQPSEWKPPPKGAGPEMPPVIVGFSDTYRAVVKAYLDEAAAQNDGEFLVKDEVTGRLHRLKLSEFRKEDIVHISREEAFACVGFEAATGEKIDLDVYVKKRGTGEWAVSRIYLHKIDGKERFVYGPNYQPMTPEAAAAQRAAAAVKAPPAEAVPKPKQPAKLALRVSFKEPSGNGMLDGGEKGGLSVAVFNAGPGPAYAVRLVPSLQSKSQVSLPAFVEVGEVKAGRSAVAEVLVEAADAVASGKVQVRLEAKEGNGFDGEPVVAEFQARTFKPPKLEVAGVSVGAGKKVKAGEPVKLTVGVRNGGVGAADAAAAFLVTGSAEVFISGEPSVPLGDLKPGQTKTAEFEFFVNKRYKAEGALPLTVTLSESRGKYGVSAAPLGLVLGKAPPAMKVVAFEGKEAGPEPEAQAPVEDVDFPPKARTAIDPHAVGVIAGIEAYRDLPPVEYAGRDAEAMYAYLTRAMGFDSRNVVLIKDERAALADLATYLGPWLEDRVTAESRVFVYFAGHGAPDPKSGEGYLIPHDGNPSYVETKAFAVKTLYANLAKLPSRDVIVVLDACFSGSGGRSVLAAGARPLVHMAKAPAAG